MSSSSHLIRGVKANLHERSRSGKDGIYVTKFVYPYSEECNRLGLVADGLEQTKMTFFSTSDIYVYSNFIGYSYKLKENNIPDKAVEFNVYITFAENDELSAIKILILESELD